MTRLLGSVEYADGLPIEGKESRVRDHARRRGRWWIPRRQFLHLAAGAAALPAVPRIAKAQAYPTRPVRIVVGYAAGGGNDIVARLIGQWLSEVPSNSAALCMLPACTTDRRTRISWSLRRRSIRTLSIWVAFRSMTGCRHAARLFDPLIGAYQHRRGHFGERSAITEFEEIKISIFAKGATGRSPLRRGRSRTILQVRE
jgi:hypothetical protein